MSESMADGPFKSASKKVDEAYEHAVAELKSSVQRAKSGAVKKVTS